MVQDFLRFLRPMSPLKDTSPRSRPKTGSSERSSTIASLARFCSMPLPIRRHRNKWSMGSFVLDPVSSCYTPPGSVKQSKQQSVASSQSSNFRASTCIAERESLDRAASSMNQPAAQLRRTETEPLAVEGVYRQAEMHRTGFWAKVHRIALTKREQMSFNRLRRATGGPVSKADVLADCEPFVFRADVTMKQFDSGHKPLKLHQDRIGSSARNEYWEEDPFNGNIYVVRWVTSEPPLGTNGSYHLSQRNDSRWSLRSMRAKDEETVMYLNVDRISTIRIVEDSGDEMQ